MEKIIARNIDEVNIQITCDEGISWELREAFSFKVPGYQFHPQYKARLWTGDIRLYNIVTRMIYRGLVSNVEKFCKDRGYEFEYETDENDLEFSLKEAEQFIETLNLPIIPRDYQIEAFVHSIRKRRLVLLSPTASGKSLIIYLIVRYLHDVLSKNRTLLVVPTINLVTQLTSDFSEYGFDVDGNVHNIYGGQDKETNRPITITTWQSIHRLPKSYFETFDSVIGDECHLFKAKSLISIMTNLVNANYRIGTTGTLDGTKTHRLVLEGLFGSVNKVTTTKKLMDQGHVSDFEIKCLLLKHSDETGKLIKKATYQEEIQYLVENKNRNRFIKNLTLSLKTNTLVLFNYVSHGQALHKLINSESDGRKVFLVYGKTEGDAREEVRRIVEGETDAIIVASFGVFSTGVNIKNLHNIIFASPSKSRIRNLQSIGRGLRLAENKEKATLYDIADNISYKKHQNYTLEHFQERLRIYSEEKFAFKIYHINLKE